MRPTATTRLGPWTIDAQQEYIEVEVGPQPDKNWKFIDAAGHGHFWKDGYPTLKVVEFDCYCTAVEDEHTDTRLECPHCGEVIKPGTTSSFGDRRMERGDLRVTLTHADGREYRLSGRAAKDVLADPIEAIPRITAALAPTSFEFRG